MAFNQSYDSRISARLDTLEVAEQELSAILSRLRVIYTLLPDAPLRHAFSGLFEAGAWLIGERDACEKEASLA
jgi:hypothetical protein